jgi:hypothetical protein
MLLLLLLLLLVAAVAVFVFVVPGTYPPLDDVVHLWPAPRMPRP